MLSGTWCQPHVVSISSLDLCTLLLHALCVYLGSLHHWRSLHSLWNILFSFSLLSPKFLNKTLKKLNNLIKLKWESACFDDSLAPLLYQGASVKNQVSGSMAGLLLAAGFKSDGPNCLKIFLEGQCDSRAGGFMPCIWATLF